MKVEQEIFNIKKRNILNIEYHPLSRFGGKNRLVRRIAYAESWNMPDGICLWFHSTCAFQISFQNKLWSFLIHLFRYSSRLVSKSSSAFPVRRVSSFTDLRDVKGGIKSGPKHCKSGGNISSIELAPSLNGSKWPEFLCSNHTGQEHTGEYDVECVEVQTTSEEMVRGYL